MYDWPKYYLRIGAYSPNTIPFGRLLEYLECLKKLVSDDTKLHLVGIEEGSTKPAILINPEYVDKFHSDLEKASNDNGTQAQNNAYRELNYLSQEDGKASQIQTAKGKNIIVFPGLPRPTDSDHGKIKGVKKAMSFFATPYKAGRKNAKSRKYEIWMTNIKNGAVIKATASIDIGIRIGTRLEKTLSVKGIAEFERSANGDWSMTTFEIDEFEDFTITPAKDTFDALKHVAHLIPEDIQDRLSQMREEN